MQKLIILLTLLLASSALMAEDYLKIGAGINFQKNIRKGSLRMHGKKHDDDDKKEYGDFIVRPDIKIDASWKRFTLNDSTLKFNAFNKSDFSAKIVADFAKGDMYMADKIRKKHSAFAGAALEYRCVELTYLKDVEGRSEGSIFDLQLLHPILEKGKNTLKIGGGIEYLDSKYVDYYFGVDSHEVTANRSLYTGDSTINFNVKAQYERKISEKLMLDIGIGYKKYGSEIENSPTVRTSHEYYIVPMIVYNF